MPWMVYRIELDGTETVIGCAYNESEAALMIDADRDGIDFDAGYHWVHEDNKNGQGIS